MNEHITDDDIDLTNSKEATASVHPSLADSFIPLPSDPSIPLTADQLQSLFPNSEEWQEMILAVNRQNNTKTVEMQQMETADEHQLEESKPEVTTQRRVDKSDLNLKAS